MVERVIDLSNVARLQDAGKRVARPAAWAVTAIFAAGTAITGIDILRTRLGWMGETLWFLAFLAMTILFCLGFYGALYTLGPGPIRLELHESEMRFTRRGGKIRVLRPSVPKFRMTLHDFRGRPELRLRVRIAGDVRWLERFALDPEGLEDLLAWSRAQGLSIREGPHNDWTGLGLENRIIISARKQRSRHN